MLVVFRHVVGGEGGRVPTTTSGRPAPKAMRVAEVDVELALSSLINGIPIGVACLMDEWDMITVQPHG